METSELTVAYQRLSEKIDNIDRKLDLKQGNTPFSETWLDIMETCAMLRVSKRTLQNYRDDGILPFSQVGGKIYFKVADLEQHLSKHYVKAFKKRR
ncbi:MAG: helix-turn-helix domain-containing protein [Bacteroidota bacterium]